MSWARVAPRPKETVIDAAQIQSNLEDVIDQAIVHDGYVDYRQRPGIEMNPFIGSVVRPRWAGTVAW